MSVNVSTGLILWIPSAGQTGSHTATVQVMDGRVVGDADLDGPRRQRDSEPTTDITSVPPFEATVAERYTYPIVATDPEGETLTFVLEAGPDGMSIDANRPGAMDADVRQVGRHTVTVAAQAPPATRAWRSSRSTSATSTAPRDHVGARDDAHGRGELPLRPARPTPTAIRYGSH
jgi:hypothetical protein